MDRNDIDLISALPRQFEELKHRDRYTLELRQARSASSLSRHASSRDWPQFRFTGT